MVEGLSGLKKVKIYGSRESEPGIGVISFNIEGKDCHEVCQELDQKYGIAARGGLHCAYLAHETIGTLDTGTIRFSLGYFNTINDIDQALKALEEIAGS